MSKTKPNQTTPALPRGNINLAALDALLAEHGHSPEAIMGAGGLLAQLTRALVERALGAELTHHLRTGQGPAEGAPVLPPGAAANCRNGF